MNLFGPAGGGKSFLANEIAIAIASGEDVFGHRVKRSGPALIIAGEGAGGLKGRFDAREQALGLPEGLPLYVVPQALDLSTNEGVAQVIGAAEQIKEASGQWPVCIIVDTLARNSGSVDENAPDGMGRLIQAYDAIREATGAAVITISHTGKDASRGARGHNSLLCAVDVEVEVKVSGGVRTATITKNKDGREGLLVKFTLEQVLLGTDEDGDEITSCYVRVLESAPHQPTKQEQCATAMKANPDWSDKQIVEHVGASRATVSRTRKKFNSGFVAPLLHAHSPEMSSEGPTHEK